MGVAERRHRLEQMSLNLGQTMVGVSGRQRKTEQTIPEVRQTFANHN